MAHKLTETVEELSEPSSLKGLFHQHRDGYPLPSSTALEEIIQLARAILFPGYFGKSQVNVKTIKYQIGVNVERLQKLLSEQILAGMCFADSDENAEENAVAHPSTGDCILKDLKALKQESQEMATELISRLPAVRRVLATDVVAAYNGDPAATSIAEILACYPVIQTLTIFRVAHELFTMGVPLIPRMMTEIAHSETGMDIHPGATIGPSFTIDHGTGVVIGETTIIGNHVTLYQGVTLGAKSFKYDADGNILNVPRHPIIEDYVTVYSNASILGRITIGHHSVIGGNIWVTNDVPPNSRIQQSKAVETSFDGGLGI